MDALVGNSTIRVQGSPKTVAQLLCALAFSREEAIVKVNGVVRPDGWNLASKDKIEVIKVVFGG
jgi:sulfur carrier protein ThiS